MNIVLDEGLVIHNNQTIMFTFFHFSYIFICFFGVVIISFWLITIFRKLSKTQCQKGKLHLVRVLDNINNYILCICRHSCISKKRRRGIMMLKQLQLKVAIRFLILA